MKLRLVSVGKDKGFTADGVSEYAGRLRRSCELELLELRAAAGPAARDQEGAAILAQSGKVKGAHELWALDERGRELTSPELAERVRRVRDASGTLTLCIGGDEGLSDEVRRGAALVWSLSKLTLPHRLARVVVLEQLYRAFEILRGSPYHRQ